MAKTRLVGDSVPMLINGVSQQSEVIRLPTQVTEQINCTSSIVQGLTKRPPTEFLKQLATDEDWSDAKVHMISRDENEQYIVVIRSGSIKVFDLEGNEHAVESAADRAYLELDSSDIYSTPLTAFRIYTIADTTILVNRNKTVLMDTTSASPSNKPYRALAWIKSAKTDKLHRITIQVPGQLNLTASYAPSLDTTINLNHAAQMLARDLQKGLEDEGLLDTWKVGHYTNIVYIESAEDDFTITASNDWSDTYISAIKDTVSGVADLPSRGFPDQRLKITGDIEDSEQGFWVKFVPDDEDLNDLDDNGFNVVEFDASAVDTGTDDKISIPDHPFLAKPKVGTISTPSSFTGGEREMVQYQEGSFTIDTLTDKEFYFVDAGVSNGVPTGDLQLSKNPSSDLSGPSVIESAGTALTFTTIGGVEESSASLTITAATATGGVATITFAAEDSPHDWVVDDQIEISDVVPVDYNGVYSITAIGATTLSYDLDSALPSDPVDGTVFGTASGAHSTYQAAKLVRVRVLPGKWVESVAPSPNNNPILTAFDSSTMPHFLIRTSEIVDDRFKFCFIKGGGSTAFPLHTWAKREVGDADSSPEPTFVDSTINDVFQWRQSLGFASGQNFILSERSHHFNFWPITVATALDDARIDVAASGSNMSNFHSIRVFQDELVGFTNEGQFTLSSSGTTLTPQSVSLSQTTRYESSETGQPINIGSSIAFPTSRGGFSSISEYFIREDQMAYVNENTRHVSHYIEGNVTNMSVSPVSDSLIIQTDADAKTLYFYQWYWQGNEKVQSAWSKWTFNTNVISANFVKDVLYLLTQASSGTTNPELCKIVLTAGDIDSGSTYKTSLDRRVLLENHDSATVTLDYTLDSEDMSVVDASGRVLKIDSQEGSTITLSEPVDSQDIYVGEIYDSQVEFTRPVMRSRYKENVDLRSRLQVQDYVLYHEDTGYFKVKVYPRAYTETPYEYEMDNLLGGTTIGEAPIVSGGFKVPIRANAREMRLVIHNDSHLPHHLVSAQWSASYSPQVYRQ